MVVRAFYDEDAVVVLDGLLYKSSQTEGCVGVKEEELAREMQLPIKLVQRVRKKLEDANLVHCEARQETRGNGRVQVQYYCVDHKRALDAIRLRLKRMENDMSDAPAQRQTQFVCPKCEGEDGLARMHVFP